MKTTQLVNEWDNLTGKVQTLTHVKDQIEAGASISDVLEELAREIHVLNERQDRIEDELKPHLFRLLGDVGLLDAPPEMKHQWESYAGGREMPILIRVLTDLKESGEPLHHFLNRVRPIEDYGSDDDG